MAKSSAAAVAAASVGGTTHSSSAFVSVVDGQHESSKIELSARKKAIQDRLKELDVKSKSSDNTNNSSTSEAASSSAAPTATTLLSKLPTAAKAPQLPSSLKTDTHWDFTLKEMAWLSADFQSERKRQKSQAKKLSNAILQYHATLASKKKRECASFEARVRRLGGKMGRMVQNHYWKKMERVVEYKQRLEGEGNRRREMDKRLVFLVRQTEMYGERLQKKDNVSNQYSAGAESSDAGIGGIGAEQGGVGVERSRMTIEEALCLGPRRTAKLPSIDYSRMDQDENYDESSFYGESIHTGMVDNASTAGAFLNNNAAGDISGGEEVLLVEDDHYEPPAEVELADEALNEQKEYAALLESYKEQPQEEVNEEVRNLLQERDMDLEILIRRLMEEGQSKAQAAEEAELEEKPLIEVIDEMPAEEEENDEGSIRSAKKKRRVCFASSHEETTSDPSDGGVAASDVLGKDDTASEPRQNSLASLNEDDHEEKDEFLLHTEELDDETTIEVEERLGRDMSYQDEIDLLRKESEMSVEELRAMYATMAEEGENAASANETLKDDYTSNNDATLDEDLNENDEGQIKQNVTDTAETSSLALLNEDDHEDKDEFHLEKEELDDETTMAAEEKLGRDMSYKEEIDLLQRESDMSIEELRAMYANMDEAKEGDATDESNNASNNVAGGVTTAADSLSSLALFEEDDQEEKDEFHLEKEELDDETTMEVEEKLGRDMSYREEIDLLKRESEMTVEELRAMYANMEEAEESNEDGDDGSEGQDGDAADSVEDDVMELSPKESSKRKHSSSDEESDGDNDDDNGMSSKKTKTDGTTDEGSSALASLAASDTKARETMLTRPFLLASWVKLRAYQHIGLNWLVSIQSRRLNGILADEMGLGKTLQTISMLAYLASYKGIWGPHLIIVPTSCLVNWEVEFKRFCPGLKVLCYYGNAKRRKELRTGWTKSNVQHVVITSYQLAVQDAFAFKRKKWYYLILDEAHNIKNFESQRWQTLIGFNTQRRLLLTGTPLQNNLMELWSLLHFLMPHVFTDRKQFSYWFSNPMDNIIEGNSKRNDDLIGRLHGIIRPFVLRRLKKDVEKQLPGKYEHIVKCQLSRRQMFLYEEFMARSSTRKTLQSGGNFMGMMSVLMQLRKVCNHPDLFEPRSVTTPFVMEPLSMSTAACMVNAVEPKSALDRLSPFLRIPLWTMGRGTPSLEKSLSVDDIVAGQLPEIKTPKSTIVRDVKEDDLVEPMPHLDNMDEQGLFSFLSRIRTAEKHDRVSRAQFINDINTRRCEIMAFPYSDRMRQAVSVGPSLVCDLPVREELTASQIASTPMELLAMLKSQEERANDFDEIAEKFVFCVPKAATRKIVFSSSNDTNSASSASERTLLENSSTAFENYFSPFKKTESRLTMCFPDKKLVQFDAGKLQTLAPLLRELKQGGHRVLIFTQMSKMLDVLEAFLNLNGHTYLRLDGSVGIDRRQRLMDRFNSDPKVFCFILSTRSGGLGINLTGADTVVFYDSDWNPAMDAQAQDRAHRIGQTRDVHIYRMVTEHSIEENILTKAKQKRNLDFLVMDEGKFHAATPDKTTAEDAETEDDDGFTKDKLQNILGIHAEGDELPKSNAEDPMSKDQLESAMTALEDEDDVKAMHSARQEAAEALQEFDESIQDDTVSEETKGKEKTDKVVKQKKNRPSNASTDSTGSDNPKLKQEDTSDDDKEMEKEFAQWQRKVGMDATTIHESLKPLERYGLNVKEQIDPYYSEYYFAEQQRLAQTTNMNNEWNIEEIEQRKVEEEQKAFEDGDLLATFPEPESLPRQRQLYIREKARLRSEIMKRKLTGQNWNIKIEERTGKAFWYNTDTGEALWEKPQVLKMLEAEEVARAEGWAALPSKPLVKILDFLIPYPERTNCAATCRKWQVAANDISFVLHVWPVELGALVMDESKLGKNHFRTISDAMQAALPGDSIELGDGHYFINDPGLIVSKPIKFVGDELEPAHVILELSGEIIWKSSGGWMEGITIRRPRIATGVTLNNEILRIESGGRLDMFNCVFDNRGSMGNCISVGSNSGGRWENTSINGGSKDRSGLSVENDAKVELTDCIICDNDGVGIFREDSADIAMSNCTVERNGLSPMKEEEAASSPKPTLIAN